MSLEKMIYEVEVPQEISEKVRRTIERIVQV